MDRASGFFRCKRTQLSRTSSRRSSFTDSERREEKKEGGGNWERQRWRRKKKRGEGEEIAAIVRSKGRRSRGVERGGRGRQVGRVTPRELLLRPSIDSTLATCWLPTVLGNFYGKLLQMGKSTLVLRATSLFFHVSRRALS